MNESRLRSNRCLTAGIMGAVLFVACGGPSASPASTAPAPPQSQSPALPAASSTTVPAASSSQSSVMTTAAWVEDLDALDAAVRDTHPDPFFKTPEAEWNARVAEVRKSLATMTKDQVVVAFMSLVGLLDTHSELAPYRADFHIYPIWAYRFSDGLYVTKAWDPKLVGARVDAIGNVPIDEVVDKVGDLIGSDNDSARLGLLPFYLFTPEILQALGIVSDEAAPAIKLTLADGSTTVVDPPIQGIDEFYASFDVVDALEGPAPDAVAKRRTPIWWTVDGPSKTFYLAYNQAGADPTEGLAALKSALADGSADRLVVDLRYDPGGNFNASLRLLNYVVHDERVNRPDRLAVLIGREGFSAGAALASKFDQATNATLIGEPTSTRPNPFLNAREVTLPHSGLTIALPTIAAQIAPPDDDRSAVMPDVEVGLTSVAFFAGRDPAFEAAKAPR